LVDREGSVFEMLPVFLLVKVFDNAIMHELCQQPLKDQEDPVVRPLTKI